MLDTEQYIWAGIGLAALAFSALMSFDAYRRQPDHYWAWIVLIFPPFSAITYFVLFLLPRLWGHRSISQGWYTHRDIRELQREIHQLDKAYHHSRLADVYRKHGRWSDARKSYEAALQRDPESFEAKARLGYALLELNEPQNALPYLEDSLAKDEGYDYGDLLLQTARCHKRLGNLDRARELYAKVTSKYSYAQARLEYAELLDFLGEEEEALKLLEKIVSDAKFAPAIQKRRDRTAVSQAATLLKRFKKLHGG
jgi:hypothetical protein